MEPTRAPTELERILGYRFSDRRLLERASTRLAYAKENGLENDAHMDALATLGDAVFDVVVITSLIEGGEHDKGVISHKKTNMVNMVQLRRLAEENGLASHVRWGKGEAAQTVWTSGRVLAECMEALIGAVYMDGGISAARAVLHHLGFLR